MENGESDQRDDAEYSSSNYRCHLISDPASDRLNEIVNRHSEPDNLTVHCVPITL